MHATAAASSATTNTAGGIIGALAITCAVCWLISCLRSRRGPAEAWTEVTERRGVAVPLGLALCAIVAVVAASSAKHPAARAAAAPHPSPAPKPPARVEVIQHTVTRYVTAGPVHHLLSGTDVVLIVLVVAVMVVGGLALLPRIVRYWRG
jgi:hypothetical protein